MKNEVSYPQTRLRGAGIRDACVSPRCCLPTESFPALKRSRLCIIHGCYLERLSLDLVFRSTEATKTFLFHPVSLHLCIQLKDETYFKACFFIEWLEMKLKNDLGRYLLANVICFLHSCQKIHSYISLKIKHIYLKSLIMRPGTKC